MRKILYISIILIIGFGTFAFSTVKNQKAEVSNTEQVASQQTNSTAIPHSRVIVISEE